MIMNIRKGILPKELSKPNTFKNIHYIFILCCYEKKWALYLSDDDKTYSLPVFECENCDNPESAAMLKAYHICAGNDYEMITIFDCICTGADGENEYYGRIFLINLPNDLINAEMKLFAADKLPLNTENYKDTLDLFNRAELLANIYFRSR